MKTIPVKTPDNWKNLQPHPLSELVEFGAGIDIDALAEHIANHGYDPAERIVLFDGKILDGRHRLPAAIKADVEPTFAEFIGDNPVAYVAKKAFRQHLTTSQRAMIAASLSSGAFAPLASQAASDQGLTNQHYSKTKAAEVMGVSVDSVKRAAAIQEHGTKELKDAVNSGDVKVTDAAKVAYAPAKVQKKAIQRIKRGQARTVADAVGDAWEGKDKEPRVPPMDALGNVLPSNLRDVFANRLIEDAIKHVIHAATNIRNSAAWNPFILWGDKVNDLESLAAYLHASLPHVICPSCFGNECDTCRHSGWLPRWRYEEMA